MPTKAQLEEQLKDAKRENKTLSTQNRSLTQSVNGLNKKIQSLKDSKEDIVKKNTLLKSDLKNCQGKVDRYQKAAAKTDADAHAFIKLSWARRILMTRKSIRTWITKISVFGK